MIELLDFLVRTVEEALDIIRSQSELLAITRRKPSAMPGASFF